MKSIVDFKYSTYTELEGDKNRTRLAELAIESILSVKNAVGFQRNPL